MRRRGNSIDPKKLVWFNEGTSRSSYTRYESDQPCRPNPFRGGIPGKDWWRLFMKTVGVKTQFKETP